MPNKKDLWQSHFGKGEGSRVWGNIPKFEREISITPYGGISSYELQRDSFLLYNDLGYFKFVLLVFLEPCFHILF